MAEKQGFFKRLVSGLTKTRDNIVSGMDSIFHGFSKIDDDFYEELEETLIMGDLGVQATMNIIEDLKRKVRELHIKEPAECRQLLIDSIKEQMDVGETAYEFENYIFTGTRGWSQSQEEDNEKMIQREQLRLELSLKEASKLLNKDCLGEERGANAKEIIVFMHYPPITNSQIQECTKMDKEICEVNTFVKLMKEYNIKRCYYGHLHGISIKEAVEGEYDGIEFKLVSADGLDFKLLRIRD